MTQIFNKAARALEVLLGLLLLGMVIMVFGNVVLRYAFNSGIVVSEELSRFFFIWLTFIGAVLATRDGTHLGMDTMVAHLPHNGKLACLVVSELAILACCAMLFWGTWQQHEVNATNKAPVTGLSMIWVFGMGYVSSIGIGCLVCNKLWRAATGQLSEAELIQIRESEEVAPEHGAATVGIRP